MNWWDQVYRYCERAQDPSFWAEPFNAYSSLAFFLAAGMAAWRARPLFAAPGQAGQKLLLGGLIVLACAIGLGSFLFHTFATRWSRMADVAPIAAFMVIYLALALYSYLELSAARTTALVTLFLVVTGLAASLSCPTQLTSVAAFSREPCLKGTMGYVPALAALLLTGALLRRRHPAGRALLIAAGIFLAAMVLRWLDQRSCNMIVVLGRPRGTHALWHLLNAVTIYVLLTAAILACEIRPNGPAASTAARA